MDIITGREAAGRAIEIISDALRRVDEGSADAGTRERMERAVRLWSECAVSPGRRVAWLKPGETIPADAQAAVVDGPAPETAPANVKLYALTAPDAAPAPAERFNRLPERGAALQLFDDHGSFRPEIRAEGVRAVREHPTACVLMAGGAATRYTDSVSALKRAMDAGELSDEQKSVVGMFNQTGLDAREAMGQSKLFAPLGAVTGKSAFEINMESVAALGALSGGDMPVIVFVSGQTRRSVEEILARHGGYGLKYLAVADQDDAPVMREDDYAQLRTADGPAVGANGGGGIVYSLGHALPRGLDGRALHDGPITQWLEGLGVERVIFTQTDDAKTVDLYIGLAAAAARGKGPGGVMAACTSWYPTPLVNGDPLTPAFRLGSYWSNGRGDFACREFAELTDDQKRLLTAPGGEGRALANTALYLFDLRLLKRVIREGGLKLHLQRHKRVQDETGAFVPVTKFEYFLPDLPELAARCGASCRLMLLRDTSALPGALRDMTVDALPAKDIGKLALSRLAILWRDRETARLAGLTVEDGALLEIGPFAEIKAEPGAALRAGARVYIAGTADKPTVVTFKKTAAVTGERSFTRSEVVE